MKTLEVLRVSGSWFGGAELLGYGSQRAVSFSVAAGEWVAIIGYNGVGKSTLLSAIVGSLPFVTGQVMVDGVRLPRHGPGTRFSAGLLHVPQQPYFPSSQAGPLPVADALDLVFSRRPGLENEVVISRSLIPMLEEAGWILEGSIPVRLFDLVSAILSVPRVLLLDEIVTAFPESLEPEKCYELLRHLLPECSFVFTDHNLSRAMSVADSVLWLRQDSRPAVFSTRDAEKLSELRRVHGDQSSETRETMDELERWFKVLHLDETVHEQLSIALNARGLGRRERGVLRVAATRKFRFLASREFAEHLSGGQRIILLWFLATFSGVGSLPERLLGHLDPDNYSKLRAWISERKD